MIFFVQKDVRAFRQTFHQRKKPMRRLSLTDQNCCELLRGGSTKFSKKLQTLDFECLPILWEREMSIGVSRNSFIMFWKSFFYLKITKVFLLRRGENGVTTFSVNEFEAALNKNTLFFPKRKWFVKRKNRKNTGFNYLVGFLKLANQLFEKIIQNL